MYASVVLRVEKSCLFIEVTPILHAARYRSLIEIFVATEKTPWDEVDTQHRANQKFLVIDIYISLRDKISVVNVSGIYRRHIEL